MDILLSQLIILIFLISVIFHNKLYNKIYLFLYYYQFFVKKTFQI